MGLALVCPGLQPSLPWHLNYKICSITDTQHDKYSIIATDRYYTFSYVLISISLYSSILLGPSELYLEFSYRQYNYVHHGYVDDVLLHTHYTHT